MKAKNVQKSYPKLYNTYQQFNFIIHSHSYIVQTAAATNKLNNDTKPDGEIDSLPT